MLKMRKDGDIRDTKNTNKNEMVETWKAESAILETVYEQGLAKQEHLTPATATSAVGFGGQVSLPPPSSEPRCDRRDSELQPSLTDASSTPAHTSPSGMRRQQALSAQWLLSRTGSGTSPSSTPLPTRAVSLPWGGLCLSSPGPHLLHVSSGISKGPQRIPRILDTGMSWGSPIIRSASRVCATRISFTAF